MSKPEFEFVADDSEYQEKAIIVGIDRGDPDWPLDESLAELERLVNTAGAEVVASTSQKLSSPNARTFVGTGKANEIAELARSYDVQLVVFDDELTPSQQANLEKIIDCAKVIDRTALILDIFSLHAVTKEGRLQVRLAQNQYLYPRLRGMWVHLASNRMGGGVGSRFGEGESQLEVDRRIVRKRIDKIRAELRKLESDRNTQRKSRTEEGITKIVLVGYTNAGKSTLLNALTGADVLIEDKLFATLDSTTREFTLIEGRKVTITDTVGFIQKLPTTLVEAFKSTLDEVVDADVIIHVCDASSHKMESQYRAVLDVLQQIDAIAIPQIVVLNKADLLEASEVEALKNRHPGSVAISARNAAKNPDSQDELEELVQRISQAASATDTTMMVRIPFDRGDLVQTAHGKCTVISVRYDETGTVMNIRCPKTLVRAFANFEIE